MSGNHVDRWYSLTANAFTNANYVPRLRSRTRKLAGYPRCARVEDTNRSKVVAFCHHAHTSVRALRTCADRLLRELS